MTSPKRTARMLHDLNDWAPLLTDTTTTLMSPRAATPPNHTGGHRDLGDLVAPTLDAPDQGAPALRTHAKVMEWATVWCEVADVRNYVGSPLLALAGCVGVLCEVWCDWEAFVEDLCALHRRVGVLTGHAPVRIAVCPRCGGDITAVPRVSGIPDYGACDSCDSWYRGPDEVAAAALEHRVAIIKRSSTYAPLSLVLEAWPELTAARLRKWVQRGKVRHNAAGYFTDDIRVSLQEKLG